MKIFKVVERSALRAFLTKSIAAYSILDYFSAIKNLHFLRNAHFAKGSTMEKSPRKVTFEYKISPNFTVYAATGAIGGLNAQGQLIINFFNERAAIPRKQTYDLNEKGGLVSLPTTEEKKDSIIRDVFLAISIPPQVARGLAQWLNNQADNFDKMHSSSTEGVPK